MRYEISDRLNDYGVNRPEIQTMLDLAAEVVYEKPGMTEPSKLDEAGKKMFIMLEFGFRRQHDLDLLVDKPYFDKLYDELESCDWDIVVKEAKE